MFEINYHFRLIDNLCPENGKSISKQKLYVVYVVIGSVLQSIATNINCSYLNPRLPRRTKNLLIMSGGVKIYNVSEKPLIVLKTLWYYRR